MKRECGEQARQCCELEEASDKFQFRTLCQWHSRHGFHIQLMVVLVVCAFGFGGSDEVRAKVNMATQIFSSFLQSYPESLKYPLCTT